VIPPFSAEPTSGILRSMSDDTPQKVGQVMTRQVITIKQDDTLEDVEEGMARFRFRHLPVVDDDGKLVGLITHRDVLAYLSTPLSSEKTHRDMLIRKLSASRIMHDEVTTVTAQDSLLKAGRLMLEKKIGCVCVVDDAGKLVGILTDTDYVRLACEVLTR